jgi:hypothetical protein
VQTTTWIYANSCLTTGGDAPSDDAWCPRCDEHVCLECLERTEVPGGPDLWSSAGVLADQLPLRAAIRAARECGPNRRRPAAAGGAA